MTIHYIYDEARSSSSMNSVNSLPVNPDATDHGLLEFQEILDSLSPFNLQISSTCIRCPVNVGPRPLSWRITEDHTSRVEDYGCTLAHNVRQRSRCMKSRSAT